MLMSRRAFFLGGTALVASGNLWARQGIAKEVPIELKWPDLIPDGPGKTMQTLRDLGVVQHGELSTPFDQPQNAEVTDAYNGKLVRIPGYLVPLDYDGEGVTSALLVPYVGACIHVPPPPANQLIFVTTSDPYVSNGLFEPVYVTGMFGAAATSTQLAEIGYALSADLIEPYS